MTSSFWPFSVCLFFFYFNNDISVVGAAFSCQPSSANSRCARWKSSSEDHLHKFKQNLQKKKAFKQCIHTIHTPATESHLDGDEDHDHPLQPQTVLLTQVAPH